MCIVLKFSDMACDLEEFCNHVISFGIPTLWLCDPGQVFYKMPFAFLGRKKKQDMAYKTIAFYLPYNKYAIKVKVNFITMFEKATFPFIVLLKPSLLGNLHIPFIIFIVFNTTNQRKDRCVYIFFHTFHVFVPAFTSCH